MKTPNYKTSNGFTLIELLVSMVITTIIVTVLVTITVTSLDIWNRNRSEVRASSQAKAMIDSMAADFESMVVRRGNNFEWLFAEFATSINSDGDPEGPNNNLSPSALDLIFFSAATDRYNGQAGDPVEDLGGDISGIRYQLIYKDPISELTNDKYKTFVLYRKLVDPNDTFQHLLGKVDDPAKDDLKDAFNDYEALNADNEVEAVENFVCENVYQFTVKFHMDVMIPDPADATKTITKNISVSLNTSEKYIITGNGLTSPPVSTVTAAQLATGRLTAVEVSLSVITDGALRQLRGRTFTDAQLSDFIAENSYQYSKLIPVPSY